MAVKAQQSADQRPLRILYTFRAPVGGLFRNVFDLIRALATRGHEIGLVCDSQTGANVAKGCSGSLSRSCHSASIGCP